MNIHNQEVENSPESRIQASQFMSPEKIGNFFRNKFLQNLLQNQKIP